MDFREFSKQYNEYLAHNFSGTGTKEEFLMHAGPGFQFTTGLESRKKNTKEYVQNQRNHQKTGGDNDQVKQAIIQKLDEMIQTYQQIQNDRENKRQTNDIRRQIPALINQFYKMGEASRRDHAISNALQTLIAANNASSNNQLGQALINARKQLFSNK